MTPAMTAGSSARARASDLTMRTTRDPAITTGSGVFRCVKSAVLQEVHWQPPRASLSLWGAYGANGARWMIPGAAYGHQYRPVSYCDVLALALCVLFSLYGYDTGQCAQMPERPVGHL